MYKVSDFRKCCQVCGGITKSLTKKKCDYCGGKLKKIDYHSTMHYSGFSNKLTWEWDTYDENKKVK